LIRLTTFQGGVLLSSDLNESTAERSYNRSHITSGLRSSNDLSAHLDRTMDLEDFMRWARIHNPMFLQWLEASTTAHTQGAGPQTPVSYHPMNTTSLHTPLSGHDIAASPGPSHIAHLRPNQSSSTLPLSPPPSLFDLNSALSATPHPFRPNDMVLHRLSERMGFVTGPRIQGDSGSNYLGQRQSPSMARDLQNLRPNDNCALFLTKIPAEVTLYEMFAVIKTGAVFCLHINPPNGAHTTKAAKLAFMNPEAAKAFLAKIQSPQGVFLGGKRIQGCYNRNRYARNEKFWQSRVLELIGPNQLMTLEYWTSHFSKFSVFELEAFQLMPTNIEGLSIMEFRFARIDGQSQTCLQCIKKDHSLKGVVQVRYGADPCGSSAC
jgi:hypothetical protein